MQRLLWNLLKISATWHLVVPFIVSLLVSVTVAYVHGHRGISEIWYYWITGPVYEVAAIYITFTLVVAHLLKEEVDPRIANIAVLNKLLPKATEYFALGAIDMHEWFEPSSQVYLTKLFSRQLTDPKFQIHRALVFADPGSLEDLHLSFGDEYYARCLLAIHEQFKVPLAFIRPTDLTEILSDFDMSDRDKLGFYPRKDTWIARLFSHQLFYSRNPRRLAFAVVYAEKTATAVVLFSKSKRLLELIELSDAAEMRPYVRMAEAVRLRAYDTSTMKVKDTYNLSEHLRLS